jgi:hypothetical protein
MEAAMQSTARRCFGRISLIAASALLAGAAAAADLDRLPALNAPIGETSVSGLSSGAFMAVQFATAWSSVIKGVGVVSGGPFYCAQGSPSTATGDCMQGPPPALEVSTAIITQKAAAGEIDGAENLARQKVYLFHGYNDGTVARSVMDATADFYSHYLGDSGRNNLFYQNALGAGHAFVVDETAQGADLNECPASASPYIDRCSYDQAGVILRHVHGALNPPSPPGALTGTVKSFDQSPYARPNRPGTLSLGHEGYVFVPRDCEDAAGPACRVHVVLHGCQQNEATIGRKVIDNAGYNGWADTNRLIVLYPQTTARPLLLPGQPFNPLACWDWWNYVSGSGQDQYVTKSGRQIMAIKAMLDDLTAGARPAADAAPAAASLAAPDELAVTDTSDRAAALTWAPVAGAASYRVWRAGLTGDFAAVGRSAAPGFADIGLLPGTAYRWHVTALTGGNEGPASTEVSAITRATPAACESPGHCPITLSAN